MLYGYSTLSTELGSHSSWTKTEGFGACGGLGLWREVSPSSSVVQHSFGNRRLEVLSHEVPGDILQHVKLQGEETWERQGGLGARAVGLECVWRNMHAIPTWKAMELAAARNILRGSLAL